MRLKSKNMLSLVLGLLGVAITMGVVACKSANRSRLRDAVVPASEAEKAFRIVERTRSYLPYEYSADGCYARASYMQMELFAANIPSRVVFVRTAYDDVRQGWADNSPVLDPAGWVYHVAPVIKVDGAEIVLDPGLEANAIGGAQTLSEWLQKMKARKFVEAPTAELNQKVAESLDRFILSRASNPDDGPIISANVRGQVIRDVGEMPAFNAETFMWNFQTMDLYLIESAAEKKITENEMIVRRALLATRTVQLAEILENSNHATGPGGDQEGVKVTLDMLKSIQEQNSATGKDP